MIKALGRADYLQVIKRTEKQVKLTRSTKSAKITVGNSVGQMAQFSST
jgi:hypothetical protein